MQKIDLEILKHIFKYSFDNNKIKYKNFEEINSAFKLSFNKGNDCNLFNQEFESNLQSNIRNYLMLEGLNYKEFKRDVIYSSEIKESESENETFLFINY